MVIYTYSSNVLCTQHMKKQEVGKFSSIFPEIGSDTKLVLLGMATNILEGKNRIVVARHYVGDGEYVYAGYSKHTNTVYIRLLPEQP